VKKAIETLKKIINIFGLLIDFAEKVIKIIDISRWFKKEG